MRGFIILACAAVAVVAVEIPVVAQTMPSAADASRAARTIRTEAATETADMRTDAAAAEPAAPFFRGLIGEDEDMGDGALWSFDADQGRSTNIGQTGFGSVFDLAWHPSGVLYGVTGRGDFLRIDPLTGAATRIGPEGTAGWGANALTIGPDGEVYAATRGGTFERLHRTTGQATVIGTFGADLECSGDLAVSATGEWYATIVGPFEIDYLARVNPATGVATIIGSIGHARVFGLAFDASGRLLGVSNPSFGRPTVVEIDRTTGQGSILSRLPDPFTVAGLTWREPGPGEYCLPSANGHLRCLRESDPDVALGDRIPLVFIHGWNMEGAPAAPQSGKWRLLQQYLDQTPDLKNVFKPFQFAYFSNGESVADLGRALGEALEQANLTRAQFAAKPLVIVAHSMGGLVARAFMQRHWQRSGPFTGHLGRERVAALITLGTPHHGSPVANKDARDARVGRLQQAALDVVEAIFTADFDQHNRMDLWWDDYDGLLNIDSFPNEKNNWLTMLNGDTSADDRIIAYAGTLTSNSCFGIFRCGAYLLSASFGKISDGIVPMDSALLQSKHRPRVRGRLMPDHDHSQIAEGRGDNVLFDQIASDLRTLLPLGDSDGDGLPTIWERRHGLNPSSATGADGANGDADGDGVTNAAELAAGTHPRGRADLTRYLAEGDVSDFFETRLALANTGTETANVALGFLKPGGTVLRFPISIPAKERATVLPKNIPGLEATPFSTIVETNREVVVERTMRWDARGYGGHTERATNGASTVWYFAEGAQGFFFTYLLLANPDARPNAATVRYLRENAPQVTRRYDLAPFARLTVDAGTDAELVNQAFGMTVVFDLPGVAERAMYFGTPPSHRLFEGGHGSAGVTAAAQDWFLAEGATGTFFDTFVLIANPGGEAAQVELTYLIEGGASVGPLTRTVPAFGRLSLNIETEHPALATANVSTVVHADRPVVVERAQYWPLNPTRWLDAHNSFGLTALSTSWGLAEGEVGGKSGAQSFLLLANPGAVDAQVAVEFLRENATSIVKVFTVSAHGRLTLAAGPGSPVPELGDEPFGAVITSDQPIAVERALYWNAAGDVWAAGTNATATPLRLAVSP